MILPGLVAPIPESFIVLISCVLCLVCHMSSCHLPLTLLRSALPFTHFHLHSSQISTWTLFESFTLSTVPACIVFVVQSDYQNFPTSLPFALRDFNILSGQVYEKIDTRRTCICVISRFFPSRYNLFSLLDIGQPLRVSTSTDSS